MRSARPRRWLGVALVALLAVAGLIGLVALFSSRDKSTFDAAQGPGQTLPDGGDRHLGSGQNDPSYSSDPPVSGAHSVVDVQQDGGPLSNDALLTALEQGNVVLAYRSPGQEPGLRALAASISGGRFDPSVAAAGQAVILDRRQAVPRGQVVALAWRHEQRATSSTDPALRAFAQYWLGRGAPGNQH